MTTSGSVPRLEQPCAFVLLAAGRGSRFGGGKLLADLAGWPVWRWALESARQAGFADLHVVTNDPLVAAGSEAVRATVHPNPAADQGIASSIAVAVEAGRRARRIVIALADMPFVEPAHLGRLARGPGAVFTGYSGGRSGVPAGFPRSDYEKLLSLNGDRGAATLDWPDAAVVRPRSVQSLIDIDTPESLRQAQAEAFRRRREASR
ncbi:nucleotidyltransferase family protein [Tsuneonella sp. SYSU-LHT278]|uniref:nucleotidyltransferase family protein n=1 Tax=Tsuneonella sediminis TaxID=3416089 RepID=UPI003F7AC2F3